MNRLCIIMFALVAAQAQSPEVQAKIASRVAQLQTLGRDAQVVAAVKQYNSGPGAGAMTEAKWKTLTVLDPAVRGLARNPLGAYLKTKKDQAVSEIFVSGADGGKVAFLSKTTSWCHKGKSKHDVPMSGRVWTGKPEQDESTGAMQVQVGLPVLDGGQPIGSIVVGLRLADLK